MCFRGRGYLAWPLIITVCLGVICARAGEPIARDADVQLRIGGDVERPLTLKGEDLAKLSRQTLRVQEHDGRESLFEGLRSSSSCDWPACRSARTCVARGC
jgi:hypothetical protein